MNHTLVIRGGALGDFLLTLPALQALAVADLTLVTRGSYSELLEACGWDHAWLNLESAFLTPLFQDGDLPLKLAAWLAQFNEIYAWLTDMDGHCERHFQRVAPGKFRLLNPVVSSPGNHASEQLAAGLKLNLSPIRWPHLPSVQVKPGRIAIHPGSGSPRKNWPVPRWMGLMEEWLAKRPDSSFLIIAGEADERVLAEMQELCTHRTLPVRYAVNLPFPELIAEILTCEHYWGHDTGITHLAASLGLPTVAWFGATDAAVWAPLGAKVRALQAPNGNLTNMSVADAVTLFRTTLGP